MIILGEQPLRPHLSKEYALALEWAEAALDLESDAARLDGKIATLHKPTNVVSILAILLMINPYYDSQF